MTARSEAFFVQITPHSRNAAAEQFDRLGADMGFLPNDSRGLTIRINSEAEQAYAAIESLLNEFLQLEIARTAGPLSGLPPQLSAYLTAIKPKLSEIQAHILQGDVPLWEVDIEQMSDQNYPFPGLVNTLNIQKLLLLSVMDYSQRQQYDEMGSALEASWRLNQAIAQRPDLVAQISTSIVSEYQAGLLRHLNQVPSQWPVRLAQQSKQQSVIKGLAFDNWIQYRSLQKSLEEVVTRDDMANTAADNNPNHKMLRSLSYWFSPAYAFNLDNIDSVRTTQHAVQRLSDFTVCSTTQSAIEQLLATESFSGKSTDSPSAVPAVLAQRWKLLGDRALTLELTQKVLELKQQRQTLGQWPEHLADATSHACPRQKWIYERAADNTITVSLSMALIPAPAVPLRYQSSP
ncbi:MAG: hypothetical protein HLUCCA11_00060 [Phormidesmis priestleyi Ana]|uniref:Uncharacterized protein n=1 Tax=Phormidesmis priestleyi Ana TaxID=1666911 RepID=A0A0N8KNU0_9CYAN|nr:MAG: hypothetical protein HLUCCA11_00060 [Phormidesmis priestleyi Ana]